MILEEGAKMIIDMLIVFTLVIVWANTLILKKRIDQLERDLDQKK